MLCTFPPKKKRVSMVAIKSLLRIDNSRQSVIRAIPILSFKYVLYSLLSYTQIKAYIFLYLTCQL